MSISYWYRLGTIKPTIVKLHHDRTANIEATNPNIHTAEPDDHAIMRIKEWHLPFLLRPRNPDTQRQIYQR